VTVETPIAPAPELDAREEDNDDYPEGPSDLMNLAVFFTNAFILISFIVSLSLLTTSNFGGIAMLSSFIMAIPVALLNAKHFFAPREGESDEDANARNPIAPYVIMTAMIIVISLAYLFISSKAQTY
jgi:hypothetical protein